jgi:hypothetical protein
MPAALVRGQAETQREPAIARYQKVSEHLDWFGAKDLDGGDNRAGKPGPISDVLQHAETAFIAGRADARSGISQPVVTNPGGGITERKIHLRNGSKLFRRIQPPLSANGKPYNPNSVRQMLM